MSCPWPSASLEAGRYTASAQSYSCETDPAACRAKTKLQSTVERKAAGDLASSQRLLQQWMVPLTQAIQQEQDSTNERFGMWQDPVTGAKKHPVRPSSRAALLPPVADRSG